MNNNFILQCENCPIWYLLRTSSKKWFSVYTLEDIQKIPIDTEELFYYCNEIINFTLGKNLRRLCLSSNYAHELGFLENTQITTLGLWDNNFEDLLNNIPNTIRVLQLITLCRPLINIPSTVKEILILNNPKQDFLSNSKLPFDCKVFYGCTMKKHII